MAALPSFLESSYHQYKEDTNVFTTWLHQTSRACGYKSTASPARANTTPTPKASPVPKRRSKGKDRKITRPSHQAKAAEKAASPQPKTIRYKTTTQELLLQAEAVAQTTKTHMALPAGIRSVTERAITARKRCAEWYAQNTGHNDSYARHESFIQVLQTALDLLKTTSTPVKDGGQASSKPTAIQLNNQFEALHVEDVNEGFSMTALDVSVQRSKPGSSSKYEIYELDDSDGGENSESNFEGAFGLFCFFEDLHQIQGRVQKTWQRFADGQISLNVASIVTCAAIDMVRRLEQEMLEIIGPEHRISQHPHLNLSLPLFDMDAIKEREDPDELLQKVASLEHRPFHDFIYLPTAVSLFKFARATLDVMEVGVWPFPVPPMWSSYNNVSHISDIRGHQERERDDTLLTRLLLDIALIEDKRTIFDSNELDDEGRIPLLEDELAKGARELWKTATITTHLVFVSRIVLEIMKMRWDEQLPLFSRKLGEARLKADETMDFVIESRVLRTRKVRWHDDERQLIEGIFYLLKKHIPLFHVDEMKRHGHEQIADLERTGEIGNYIYRHPDTVRFVSITPDDRADFLLTHNPLHCGAMSLRLTSSIEEAGVALANHQFSIFTVAHLYNALHQIKLTTIRWPEIERIIDLHKKAIFADHIPKKATEMYRTFAYRIGFTGASKYFDKQSPWQISTTPACGGLKKLLDSKESTEHAIVELVKLVDEHAQPSDRIQKPRHKSHAIRQLNPVQMLSRFEQYLPAVLQNMDLDYITLTKKCNKLMKTIRLAWQEDQGVVIEDLSGSLSKVTMAILAENRMAHRRYEKTRDESPFMGGLQLQIACTAFESFCRKKLAHLVEQPSTSPYPF